MRTLLVHEWLSKTGGSENVFEQLMLAFPEAEKYCLWNEAPERFGFDVQESWLANSRLRNSKTLSLTAMPSIWSSVPVEQYDRVLTSSHAFSHQLATRAAKADVAAFAYIYTPARYIWTPDLDGRGQTPLARVGRGYFRRLDKRRTSGKVHYAGISEFVSQRIRDTWGQESKVIYPGVDTTHIQSNDHWADDLDESERELLESLPDGFILGASRFVEYKRLDTAIEVGEQLGRPVVLAGGGPDEERLQVLAADSGVPVTFVDRPSNALLYSLYQAAALFVFMAIEDFGIMPVEAIALATPTLVRNVGGAAEIMRHLQGGVAVDLGNLVELREAAERALSLDMAVPAKASRMFSNERFKTEVVDWMDQW